VRKVPTFSLIVILGSIAGFLAWTWFNSEWNSTHVQHSRHDAITAFVLADVLRENLGSPWVDSNTALSTVMRGSKNLSDSKRFEPITQWTNFKAGSARAALRIQVQAARSVFGGVLLKDQTDPLPIELTSMAARAVQPWVGGVVRVHFQAVAIGESTAGIHAQVFCVQYGLRVDPSSASGYRFGFIRVRLDETATLKYSNDRWIETADTSYSHLLN